jgi:hypothetical protein
VQIRLVVRAGIRPRGLTLGAVCDSAAAVDALRSHWGYPVQLGEVYAASRHDHVRFTASVDGHDLVDLAVHTADVINGSDLMTFDNLHLVRIGDDAGLKLVQVDPEYTIHQADRGRPEVRLPDLDALGMHGNLRLTRPSSASRSAPTPTSCRSGSSSTPSNRRSPARSGSPSRSVGSERSPGRSASRRLR